MSARLLTNPDQLPVAGVRLEPRQLRSAARNHRIRAYGRRALYAGLLGLALLFLAVGFFSNDNPGFQTFSFATIMLMVVGVLSWSIGGMPGAPDLFRARPLAPIYPPNALADNLRDVMQGILDILSANTDPVDRRVSLQSKVPDAALAFSAFFGRRVDRIRDAHIHGDDEVRGLPAADRFAARALRFAEVTADVRGCPEDVVREAGRELLSAYRGLMQMLKVHVSQVLVKEHVIDPVVLPKWGGDRSGGPRVDRASATAVLAPAAQPALARISALDAELARVQDVLSPEDADEWARIVGQHLPGLEATFLDAHRMLGSTEQVVSPFARALDLIADSLERILARSKRGVADGLKTSARFIELRHSGAQ